MPNPNQTYFITLILTQFIQNRFLFISSGHSKSGARSRAAAASDLFLHGPRGSRILGKHREALRVQAKVANRTEAEDCDGRTPGKTN